MSKILILIQYNLLSFCHFPLIIQQYLNNPTLIYVNFRAFYTFLLMFFIHAWSMIFYSMFLYLVETLILCYNFSQKIFTSVSLNQFLFLVTLWWPHPLNNELKSHWVRLSFSLPFLLFKVILLFKLISLGCIILFPSSVKEAEQNDRSFYNSTSTLHFSHLLVFSPKLCCQIPTSEHHLSMFLVSPSLPSTAGLKPRDGELMLWQKLLQSI